MSVQKQNARVKTEVASPVSGMIWLSKLIRQFDGDTVAVAEYLSAVSAAMAGQMFRAQEVGEEEAAAACEAIEAEVDLWLRGHLSEWTGAEWVLAASVILAAVVENARRVREVQGARCKGQSWEEGHA